MSNTISREAMSQQVAEANQYVTGPTDNCACAATSHGHDGNVCGKPAAFAVEVQAYAGAEKSGSVKKVGLCDGCWQQACQEFPHLFGD